MEKFVCFDLDGTLIDTLTGITKAVNVTLKEIGLPYQYDKKTVETFIGRGAKRLFNLASKNNEKPADFDLFLKNYDFYFLSNRVKSKVEGKNISTFVPS